MRYELQQNYRQAFFFLRRFFEASYTPGRVAVPGRPSEHPWVPRYGLRRSGAKSPLIWRPDIDDPGKFLQVFHYASPPRFAQLFIWLEKFNLGVSARAPELNSTVPHTSPPKPSALLSPTPILGCHGFPLARSGLKLLGVCVGGGGGGGRGPDLTTG